MIFQGFFQLAEGGGIDPLGFYAYHDFQDRFVPCTAPSNPQSKEDHNHPRLLRISNHLDRLIHP